MLQVGREAGVSGDVRRLALESLVRTHRRGGGPEGTTEFALNPWAEWK